MPDASSVGMLEKVRRHPIACFLVVTYAITWGAWSVLAASGVTVGTGFSPLYMLGLVGPLIGALVTTAVIEGRPGLRDLFARMIRVRRVGLPWWSIAVGSPLAVAATMYVFLIAVSMFLLGPIALPSWRSLGAFTGFPITNAIVLWLLLVIVNGFGEETGWRGFLLPQLQRRWSPLASSMMIAGIWATWHLPAFVVNANYRSMSIATIPMFVLGLACGSVVLTWLYNRGRQSIALVAIWHGTFNMFSGTVAARGSLAAVESSVVMAIALILIARELHASRRERHHQPATHVMA